MSIGDLAAIIGVLVAFIGGLVVRDRQVMKTISDGDRRAHSRIDSAKTEMESKLSGLENRVDDKFVRKEYFDTYFKNIENMFKTITEAQAETNKRIEETNRRIDKYFFAWTGKKTED